MPESINTRSKPKVEDDTKGRDNDMSLLFSKYSYLNMSNYFIATNSVTIALVDAE